MTGRPTGPGAAVLYGRSDCSLCFVLNRSAARASRRHGIPLVVIDVDSDPDLVARYGSDIPVLSLPGGEVIRGRTEARQVEEAFLRAARSITRGRANGRAATWTWPGLRRLLEATGMIPKRPR